MCVSNPYPGAYLVYLGIRWPDVMHNVVAEIIFTANTGFSCLCGMAQSSVARLTDF